MKSPLHLVELARDRTLEGKDRLLLVADGKNRALVGTRASSSREFRHQSLNDLPLLRARILRLVDQHVINTEIELVVNPGRVHGRQHRQRLVDQVIVVEQAASVLFSAIAIDHLLRDRQQRGGTVTRHDRAPTVEQCGQARLFFGKTAGKIRMLFGERTRDQALALRSVGIDEDREKMIKARSAAAFDCCNETVGLLAIVGRACGQYRGGSPPPG